MTRRELPVLLFSLAYLAAAAPWAWSTGNAEFVFYIVVMVGLGLLVLTVHRRVGLHPWTLWGLSLWGLAHVLGGLLPIGEDEVLYDLWLVPGRLRYDHAVHAAGFGLCTWVSWQGLAAILASRGGPAPRPTAGTLLLAALAGIGLGALNEVVEFVATLTVPETNVGGYENTGWDLVSNTIGALLAAVWIALAGRRS